MYLSKFSKLTRMILDMSEKSEVTLSEEVSALKLYLDLEKIRFEDFEYIIKIDPNLSIESIEIPSMIIQPYVENAIKHGLLHKKGPKLLQLILRKFEENYLVIGIDDNGIGRKRSSELNQIKINKHKSFATEANKKRLEILNSENRKINIQYMDKVNSNGIPEGTFVQIMLPIIWNQTREKILKE